MSSPSGGCRSPTSSQTTPTGSYPKLTSSNLKKNEWDERLKFLVENFDALKDCIDFMERHKEEEGKKKSRDLSPHRGRSSVDDDDSKLGKRKIGQEDAIYKRIQNGVNSNPYHHRLSPFTMKICTATLPMEFTLPDPLGLYDGKEDPLSHVRHFDIAMDIWNLSDEIRCKILAYTLRGAAGVWFRNLPPNSMSSFEQLSEMPFKRFVWSHYQARRRRAEEDELGS